MAITLNDLKERLKDIHKDLDEHNYGNAHRRTINLIGILENSGIVIHAIATTEDKQVVTDDSQEN